jgi:hypothetical protein
VTDLPLLKQQEQLTWRRGRRFAKGETGNRSGRPRDCRAAEFLLDGTGKGPAACGRRTAVARTSRADLPQIQVRLGAWLNFWLYRAGFCIRLLRRSALMPPRADPPARHSSCRGQAAMVTSERVTLADMVPGAAISVLALGLIERDGIANRSRDIHRSSRTGGRHHRFGRHP